MSRRQPDAFVMASAASIAGGAIDIGNVRNVFEYGPPAVAADTFMYDAPQTRNRCRTNS
jgi:hypothetical protein